MTVGRSAARSSHSFLPLSLALLVGSRAMGLSFSSLFTSLSSLVRWSKDQDVRILMLGLDAAGKVRHHSIRFTSGRVRLTNFTCLLDDYFVPFTGDEPLSCHGDLGLIVVVHGKIGEVVPTIPSESLSFFGCQPRGLHVVSQPLVST